MFVVIEVVGLILWVGVMFMAFKNFFTERFWFWLCQAFLVLTIVECLRPVLGS